MSSNDLWCDKCKSQYHPAVDCVEKLQEKIEQLTTVKRRYQEHLGQAKKKNERLRSVIREMCSHIAMVNKCRLHTIQSCTCQVSGIKLLSRQDVREILKDTEAMSFRENRELHGNQKSPL